MSGDDPTRVGPYRVVGRLGSGAMGTVYAAADRTGQCVAVKMVHATHARSDEFRARFAREALVLDRVRGRCTVRVLDSDPRADRPWLVTEYVPGPTLWQYTKDWGRITGPMLLGVAAGTAEALAATHAAGVIHRDLKPGNVILSPEGPKVLDFGIARAADDTTLTATGGVAGTPGWIAPEAYDGAELGPAADMFAWGALVAFAATGREPFGTGAPEILAYRVTEEAPILDGVPDSLRPLVRAALHRDPERRPSATEALSAVYALWDDGSLTEPVPADEALGQLFDRDWNEIPDPPQAPSSSGMPALVVAVSALVLGTASVGYAMYDVGPFAAEAVADEQQEPDTPADASEEHPPFDASELPAEVNGNQISAIDGDDTIVLGEDDEPVWIVQMVDAQPTDEGVEFTALATYQSALTGLLTGQNFHVLTEEGPVNAAEGPLTGDVDAWSGSQTIRFTVPEAPEQGVVRLQGSDYAPGQPGFPPMGLCYEVGGGFQPFHGDEDDLDNCG